jgi:hypothetical protein
MKPKTEPVIRVYFPALDLFYAGTPTQILEFLADQNWQFAMTTPQFKLWLARRMRRINKWNLNPKQSPMQFVLSLESLGILAIAEPNTGGAK